MFLNLHFVLRVITVSIVISRAMSHSRFRCPPARNSNTGIKTGPCGSDDGDFSGMPLTLQPGPLTIVFEESITHRGAPWRLSLSGDSDDTTSCLLLDHIPHNDQSSPRYNDESSYTQYKLTIEIPDVACERCSLHLVNPMTDKIGDLGKPSAEGCTDPDGTCFSVYHSCSVPLRITGATARSDYVCPGQPSDWPTTWVGDEGASVQANVLGVYRRESSTWTNDGWLETAPAKYWKPASNSDCDCLGSVSCSSTNQGNTNQGNTTSASASTGGNLGQQSDILDSSTTMDRGSTIGIKFIATVTVLWMFILH